MFKIYLKMLKKKYLFDTGLTLKQFMYKYLGPLPLKPNNGKISLQM